MKINIFMMAGIALILSFVFGYELASNQEKITYDLYKFTNGNIDLTEITIESPKDRIQENQIFVLKDKVEIKVPDAEWSSYEPTGSMKPILTHTANGLYVIPKGPEDVQAGDIIAYSLEGHDKDIVHRVVETQKDEHGNILYITKGDANPTIDPELVPFEDVKRVLIGVIY